MVNTTEPLESDSHLKVCIRNSKVNYMEGLVLPQDNKTPNWTIQWSETWQSSFLTRLNTLYCLIFNSQDSKIHFFTVWSETLISFQLVHCQFQQGHSYIGWRGPLTPHPAHPLCSLCLIKHLSNAYSYYNNKNAQTCSISVSSHLFGAFQ